MATITILPENNTVEVLKNETVLSALQRTNHFVDAPCGGVGKCGKCKIRITNGNIPIAQADTKYFSAEELEKGYRLSCLIKPDCDLEIELLTGDKDSFEVLSASPLELTQGTVQKNSEYGIAIDIGTTTIAVQLIDTVHKTCIETVSRMNHQRAYGSDVISRIMASNEGKKEDLQKSAQNDIIFCIEKIISITGIDTKQVQKMAIGANTTMTHLLCGFSCETLGVFPFTPVDIKLIEKSFLEIFDSSLLNCEVTILPGISTYVGSDIVSGMNALQFHNSEKVNVLIDLGTNGEMAIGNKDAILCTSVAAGPAFEGGNISCGTGSIAGAVTSIDIKDGKVAYKTIQDAPPIGLCGSAVVECAAELLREGILDETGSLDDDYDDGFVIAKTTEGNDITFLPKDIREIQLAKSAVRAGLEVLISEYGITYKEINTVYIAGGFGYKLNYKKAIEIGMLPKELEDKIVPCGNTSLFGAVHYLIEKESREHVQTIAEKSKEIALATNSMFNDLYMEHMIFGDE